MRYLTAPLLILVLATSGRVAAQGQDGSFFLRECGAAIKQADGGVLSAEERFGTAFCASYVSGFLDGVSLTNDSDEAQRNICLPERGIVNEQAIRIFVKYLQENPDILHQSGRMSLYISLAMAFPCAGEQKNIAFTNIPDFLRNEWTIVLGQSPKGTIDSATGSVIFGNAIVMFSTKENAKVIDDYSSLEITKVIQYNLRNQDSDSGFNTFFQLFAKEGDVLLYPSADFWHICIRVGKSGPYAVYTAIQPNRMKSLKDTGRYEKYLVDRKKLLQSNYCQ